MEQRLAIKFCFKAGKSMTETLQMVNAAYGDQAISCSNVFRWYGRFNDAQEDTEDNCRSGQPTVSKRQQCREDLSIVASKPSPFTMNASRRGEYWQGHSEKECSWRFAKTEDLFALCSTLFDSRAERPENCSLPRFDCHSRQ